MTSRRTIGSGDRQTVGVTDRRITPPDHLLLTDESGQTVIPSWWIDGAQEQDAPSKGSNDDNPTNLVNPNITIQPTPGDSGLIWRGDGWEQDSNSDTAWDLTSFQDSFDDLVAFYVINKDQEDARRFIFGHRDGQGNGWIGNRINDSSTNTIDIVAENASGTQDRAKITPSGLLVDQSKIIWVSKFDKSDNTLDVWAELSDSGESLSGSDTLTGGQYESTSSYFCGLDFTGDSTVDRFIKNIKVFSFGFYISQDVTTSSIENTLIPGLKDEYQEFS